MTTKRTRLLEIFYLLVQAAMLLTSIPNVAGFFAAYDPHGSGPLWFGFHAADIKHYGIGIGVDLVVALTGWAALKRYQATRQALGLWPHVMLIAVCASLSVLANYEDVASMNPAQYARVSIFGTPALAINPFVVALPPLITLLLIFLVPSILAEAKLKSADEQAAEANAKVAEIQAKARIKEAQARANAQVRAAQLQGMKESVTAAAPDTLKKRLRLGAYAETGVDTAADEPDGSDGSDGTDTDPDGGGAPFDAARFAAEQDATAEGVANVTTFLSPAQKHAMLNAEPLHKRVRESGVLTVQDLAEALSISPTQARNILKKVPSATQIGEHATAAYQAPASNVQAWLEKQRSAQMRMHAQTLKLALNPRRARGARKARAQGGPQPSEQFGAQPVTMAASPVHNISAAGSTASRAAATPPGVQPGVYAPAQPSAEQRTDDERLVAFSGRGGAGQ